MSVLESPVPSIVTRSVDPGSRESVGQASPATETKWITTRSLLSAMWVFAMFNYLYADVIGLMDPILLPQYLTGTVNGMSISRDFLLAAALLMEIPILMTLLCRVLPYRSNRIANIVAGALNSVVVAATLFVGKPAPYYVFFASIEIACTLLIVAISWRWRADELVESRS